jgi:chromosome partitioning protein
MRSIAIYSLKGGVGKTTLAVTLAWAAATLSSRRTLLWDLDAQGAASFMLGGEQAASEEARAVFSRDVTPAKLVHATPIPASNCFLPTLHCEGSTISSST